MTFSSCEDPIGLFDSGVGGLTIMKEVARLLPHENLVYLGDTAKLPYGDKSPQAILRYTLENVSFLIGRKIKLLIVACFTASAHALEVLEHRLSIPVIGVIRSGVQEVLSQPISSRIAILGTSSTIKSGILQALLAAHHSKVTVFPIACPLFVPLIEENFSNHPVMRIMASHYLDCLKMCNIDTALLACTHYPLIRPIIQEILGLHVQLIEPAKTTAIHVQHWLEVMKLQNLQEKPGIHEFYATDDPDKFLFLANRFFGSEIKQVIKIPNHP